MNRMVDWMYAFLHDKNFFRGRDDSDETPTQDTEEPMRITRKAVLDTSSDSERTDTDDETTARRTRRTRGTRRRRTKTEEDDEETDDEQVTPITNYSMERPPLVRWPNDGKPRSDSSSSSDDDDDDDSEATVSDVPNETPILTRLIQRRRRSRARADREMKKIANETNGFRPQDLKKIERTRHKRRGGFSYALRDPETLKKPKHQTDSSF